MHIRRFIVRDIKEAIQVVKRDLGPEAVILSTRNVKDPTGSSKRVLEVTAATDRAEDKPVAKRPAHVHAPSVQAAVSGEKTSSRLDEIEGKLAAIESLLRPDAIVPKIKNLEENIHQVRNLMETLLGNMERQGMSEFIEGETSLDELLQRLIASGVDKFLARQMVLETLQRLDDRGLEPELYGADQLAEVIMEKVSFDDPFAAKPEKGPAVHALVGPTGVGKTTTIAKLAAQQVFEYKRTCCLLTIDTFRIGAFDQLQNYASILRIPIEIAKDEHDLAKRIKKHSDKDVIFIDTAGMSQRDEKMMGELESRLKGSTNIKVHLILAANASEQTLKDVADRFNALNPSSYIIGKLDETEAFGPIFNLMAKRNTPASYFTVGQNVPDDIEAATRERVADLLLDLTTN